MGLGGLEMSQTTRTDYRHALYRDFSFRCSSCPEYMFTGGKSSGEDAPSEAWDKVGIVFSLNIFEEPISPPGLS